MIAVTPIQEKKEQARLAALCHVPFFPDALAYRAADEKGAFAGICQFSMNEKGGHLLTLATPTPEDPLDAVFVMGRAALNFIDLCGVGIAFFEGEGVDDATLSRIGFSRDEGGVWSLSLAGFFTKPCQH